ncbi:MAG TPA: hypothetical protein VMD91_17090 [Candidatus Sulfotelmatobacter sp.]|nr:hypothetical protein [Candidatus Sulfotelmatobacter sp.]
MQQTIRRDRTASIGDAFRTAAHTVSQAWTRLTHREDNSLAGAVMTDQLERELAERAFKRW